MDKNHPGQNLSDKRPPNKPPDKNHREQLTENLYMGLLSGFFVIGLPKMGGPRCIHDVLFGGSGMCDKVWQGKGVKIGQK